MTPPLDLDAYLARIGGLAAAPDTTLTTLNALIAQHVAAIPFENLSPLLGEPVDISPAAVQAKLVAGGRGGYCYEHNRLFADVLRHLGFTVHELGARVVWNQPPGAITPRSHMLLEVDTADGPRLVDVGFGGLTLTSALRLQADIEQITPHEPFRLLRDGDDWTLQARLGEAWKPLYRFDRVRHHACDYVAPNYFLATHPDSVFTANLMLARAGRNQRWTLFNRDYAEYHGDGRIVRRTLADPVELTEVLQRAFGIPPALCATAQPRLARLFDAG